MKYIKKINWLFGNNWVLPFILILALAFNVGHYFLAETPYTLWKYILVYAFDIVRMTLIFVGLEFLFSSKTDTYQTIEEEIKDSVESLSEGHLSELTVAAVNEAIKNITFWLDEGFTYRTNSHFSFPFLGGRLNYFQRKGDQLIACDNVNFKNTFGIKLNISETQNWATFLSLSDELEKDNYEELELE